MDRLEVWTRLVIQCLLYVGIYCIKNGKILLPLTKELFVNNI